jgi:hypothetical protein
LIAIHLIIEICEHSKSLTVVDVNKPEHAEELMRAFDLGLKGGKIEGHWKVGCFGRELLEGDDPAKGNMGEI